MTVTQPAPNNQAASREETVTGGLLVHLLNPTYAHKLDDVSNIAFYDQASGEYRSGAAAINENSIQRVRITIPGQNGAPPVVRYYQRIANDDGTSNSSGFKGNAWRVIDGQTGQPIAGQPVQICCGGFSGNMTALAFSQPTTNEGRSAMAAYRQQFDPQNNDAARFLGTLTSIASAHIYGHSAGAGPALTLQAGLQARGITSHTTLVEPLQAGPQADRLAEALSAPNSELAQLLEVQGTPRTQEQWKQLLINPAHLTSVVGVRNGSRGMAERFLGPGIGNVVTVNLSSQSRSNTDINTAIQDHRALASVRALTQGPGTTLQSAGVAPAAGAQATGAQNIQNAFGGNDIGQMIMSIIMSLLSGEGFGSIMQTLMPMLSAPANGGPNGAQRTPAGSGGQPTGPAVRQ